MGFYKTLHILLYGHRALKVKWMLSQIIKTTLSLLAVAASLYVLSLVLSSRISYSAFKNFLAGEIVDFTNADNITGYSYYIVPNVIHFIHFESNKLSFIEMISIKAAYLNHKPDKIIIHCDCHSIGGKYWNMLNNISRLEVHYIDKPTHIFGKPLSSVYHASDIARLQLLMKYGGIFLDGDSYVVKSLDSFRKYEMAIGWPPGQSLGTQVIVAHKNARFLQLWYRSYHYYKADRWYYNAGELPTQFILQNHPNLVHRVPYDFGVHNLIHLLYGVRSSKWKNFHAIHLLIRHKSYLEPTDVLIDFDENNIKTYNKTFGDMARLILHGTTDYVI